MHFVFGISALIFVLLIIGHLQDPRDYTCSQGSIWLIIASSLLLPVQYKIIVCAHCADILFDT